MITTMALANTSIIYFLIFLFQLGSFPVATVVKNLPADAVDKGSILGLGRSPGGGNGNPLQYSCLENPTDRGT